MLPQNPESALLIPCAISSLLTFKLSSPVDTPSAGTLMGTCKIPKNVRANMAGIVLSSASQFVSLKSVVSVVS